MRVSRSVLYVNVAITRSTRPVVSAGSRAAVLTHVQLMRFPLPKAKRENQRAISASKPCPPHGRKLRLPRSPLQRPRSSRSRRAARASSFGPSFVGSHFGFFHCQIFERVCELQASPQEALRPRLPRV